MRGLFKEVDLPGITVTLDASHTSRETILALQEQPGADTLATIKGNARLAYDLIAQDGNWAGPEVRRAAERWMPGHGRWEHRELVTTGRCSPRTDLAPIEESIVENTEFRYPPASPGERSLDSVNHTASLAFFSGLLPLPGWLRQSRDLLPNAVERSISFTRR